MAKVQMVCSCCGSDDVTRDACARWNVDNQQWEMVTVYDNTDCQKCEGETRLEEREIEPDYIEGLTAYQFIRDRDEEWCKWIVAPDYGMAEAYARSQGWDFDRGHEVERGIPHRLDAGVDAIIRIET